MKSEKEFVEETEKNSEQLGEEESTKDIYEEKGVEKQLEDDEITSAEAGFMEGYDNPKLLQCHECKEKDFDLEHAIEKEVDGTIYVFCSEKCANNFTTKNNA